jgi:3-oxoacyl-[acyl-carrier-protein] synthase-3
VLPVTVQTAASLNEALGRPAGWFEGHAGIHSRRIWGDQDPLTAAARAAQVSLRLTSVAVEGIGALIVTSEAPPLLAGTAAALHHRLGLKADTPALEVGGACTGFLASLWTAQALLSRAVYVLVIAVEAPTRYLKLQPGPAGEAAALFGDATAAALLSSRATGQLAVPLREVRLGADGSGANLLRVERAVSGEVEVNMEGTALADRAIQTMAQAVRDLTRRHGLAVSDLEAVVAHGGNGRMPALLARQLQLPLDRVWSETPQTGNLGSASLPVAWGAHEPMPRGPVAWTAVGAGLTWAVALTGEFA